MSSLGNKVVFSENLKYYIEKSGRDRRELAEIWGFPYSTVTEWINGKKYPRIDKIEAMANYFGITKADLIEERKEKPSEYEGLSNAKINLIEFAKSIPDDKTELALRLIRTIVEGD